MSYGNDEMNEEMNLFHAFNHFCQVWFTVDESQTHDTYTITAGDKNKYHKWRLCICVCVCRALCYLKVERFSEAKQDCDAALKLEPTNKKAFYRRALANKGLKV